VKRRTMPADSRIGEELRPHERALLFAGVCPDCADDSLLEVPAVCPTPYPTDIIQNGVAASALLGPTLIKCSRCSFAARMNRAKTVLALVAGSAS